nr:DUF1799 domain-containing protein [Hydrogenispora ethanolica]
MPENGPAWKLWLLANTQWRIGLGAPVGLDYPAVLQIAAIHGIEVTPAVFGKLRRLEMGEMERLRKEG